MSSKTHQNTVWWEAHVSSVISAHDRVHQTLESHEGYRAVLRQIQCFVSCNCGSYLINTHCVIFFSDSCQIKVRKMNRRNTTNVQSPFISFISENIIKPWTRVREQNNVSSYFFSFSLKLSTTKSTHASCFNFVNHFRLNEHAYHILYFRKYILYIFDFIETIVAFFKK